MTKEQYRHSYAVRLAEIELRLTSAADNNDIKEFMAATTELSILSTEPEPEFFEANTIVTNLRRNTNGTVTRLRGTISSELGT